jgi:WD40 repeat protein
VLASADNIDIVIWDPENKAPPRHLTNHLEHVVCLDFSPDGKLLATASGDQTIKLWNTDTWEELTTLKGHEHEVHNVGFSSDGKLLISSGKDETARIWSVDSRGSRSNSLTIPDGWFLPLNWRAGDRLLLHSEDSGSLRSLDPKRLAMSPAQAAPPTLSRSIASCVDRTGDRLALALPEGPVELWRIDPPSKLGTLAVSSIPASALALGETKGWLAVQRTNGNLEVWDINENRLIKTFEPDGFHPGYGLIIRPVSFFADDRRLARFQGGSREDDEKLEVILFPEDQRRVIAPGHKTGRE